MLNIAKEHDIVQLTELHKWCGALVYVTEVYSWGIQGFIFIPGEGQAFIRATIDEIEYIGPAAMRIKERG